MSSQGHLPFWPRSQPPRLVLVSDLDHTMVQNEDPSHRRQLTFNAVWHCAASPAHQSLLIYSTGRSPRLYRQLWEEAPLLTPDVLICSVGTEIFYLTHTDAADDSGSIGDDAAITTPTAASVPASTATTSTTRGAASGGGVGGRGGGVGRPVGLGSVPHYEPDSEWEALLDRGWDRERVLAVAAKFPELRRQVDSEQRRHKLSFHLEAQAAAGAKAGGQDGGATAPGPGSRGPQQVLHELQEALQADGLRVKAVYSGGRDLDLLAEGAGKGAALHFLLERLWAAGLYPTHGVQVNGDSGNDIELFQVPGVRGCVVANAFPELKGFARRADGAAKAAAIKAVEAGACDGNGAGGGAQAAGPECNVFQATQPCAGGIMEALRHFNLLPHECFPPDDGGASASAAPRMAKNSPDKGEAPKTGPQAAAPTSVAPGPGPAAATAAAAARGPLACAATREKAPGQLVKLSHVVAAVHTTLSLLMGTTTDAAEPSAEVEAVPVPAAAGPPEAGSGPGAEVAAATEARATLLPHEMEAAAGGVGRSDSVGDAGGGSGVAAAAASVAAAAGAAAAGAAAAGVWLDQLEVTAATAAAAAAAGPPGLGGGSGRGWEEWIVHCQAFQLLPSGRRNLSSMIRASLAVCCEFEDGAAVGSGAGGGDATHFTANVRSAEMIGMGDVALPPLEI